MSLEIPEGKRKAKYFDNPPTEVKEELQFSKKKNLASSTIHRKSQDLSSTDPIETALENNSKMQMRYSTPSGVKKAHSSMIV